ncbi:hypothetical protein AGMMS49992_25700 [Clostridia bacterium]|nr:hypothetical protein AGMMS49992_25700 [Clostridia bacterium]
MRKLKLYLDTSVISHLDAPDVPEKMADTLSFWSAVRAGRYDIVLSSVTTAELARCSEPKRTVLNTLLSEVDFDIVPADDRVLEIANRFLEMGILHPKSFDDCQHIAAAIVSRCDAIVSWNFKHIVNHRTMGGVRVIAVMEHLPDMLVMSPSSFMEGDKDDT